MTMKFYPAVIGQEPGDTGYGIQIIDVPDAISRGNTIAGAVMTIT